MTQKNKALLRLCAGLALMAGGILVINYRVLVEGVIWRLGANDPTNASINLVSAAIQSALVMLALVLLPRAIAWLFVGLIAISASINIGYFSILQSTVSRSSVEWMMSEARSFQTAYIQFSSQILTSLALALGAAALLVAGRAVASGPARELGVVGSGTLAKSVGSLIVLVLLFAPVLTNKAKGAETNVYGFAAQTLLSKPPQREAVTAGPVGQPSVRKIVWLVDESVQWHAFTQLIGNRWVKKWNAIDFGEATSLANCSTQSNVSLRWGVNVRSASQNTDLRTQSTIWQFAKKAGFHTKMYDGQVFGAPQNYLWSNERQMIDEFLPSAGGMDTDKHLASKINADLKTERLDFIYVVLRGFHYQYTDHYPGGKQDIALPPEESYAKALAYGRSEFLDNLLNGVDLSKVAVFYTSDHGQNLRKGAIPHCSSAPHPDELSVPLLAVVPDHLRAGLVPTPGGRFSHSQLFPTSLVLFGYGEEYARRNFDQPLGGPSARIVRFGKKIIPEAEGGSIDFFVLDSAGTPR